MKVSFPTALPLGLESRLETCELQVDRAISVREVCERIAAELPEGLRPFGGDIAFTGERWQVAEILYEISPAGADLPAPEEVEEIAARESIPVQRRNKVVDLALLLRGLEHRGDHLALSIAWDEKGIARPEDLLRALNRDPDGYRMVKTGVVFETSTGEIIRRTHDETNPDQWP